MIKLSGLALSGIDNRLMTLQFVEQGLTEAAVVAASGELVPPSEVSDVLTISRCSTKVEDGWLPYRGAFAPASGAGWPEARVLSMWPPLTGSQEAAFWPIRGGRAANRSRFWNAPLSRADT